MWGVPDIPERAEHTCQRDAQKLRSGHGTRSGVTRSLIDIYHVDHRHLPRHVRIVASPLGNLKKKGNITPWHGSRFSHR